MVRQIKKPKSTLKLNLISLGVILTLLFAYGVSAGQPVIAINEVKKTVAVIPDLEAENTALAREIATIEGQFTNTELLQAKGFVYQKEAVYLKSPAVSLGQSKGAE